MVTRRQILVGSAVTTAGLSLLAIPYLQPGKSLPKLKLASSIYVGWMPWFYAAESGLIEKIAQSHNVEIEFVRADYADTISLFGARAVDAVTMTNIDAIPALISAKIEADAILVGSFSNGNDAIMMRPDRGGELAGKTLGLVEFSVSHYLLDRVLQKRGLAFDAVSRLNIADSAMIASMTNNKNEIDGVVTWNPIVDELERRNFATRIADSSEILHEIADLLVVNRKTIDDTPEFGDALLEIWFEVTSQLRKNPEDMEKNLGNLSGTDQAGYRRQLDHTILNDTPQSTIAVIGDGKIQTASRFISEFSLRNNLVNQMPDNWISFPGGDRGILHYTDKFLVARQKNDGQVLPATSG